MLQLLSDTFLQLSKSFPFPTGFLSLHYLEACASFLNILLLLISQIIAVFLLPLPVGRCSPTPSGLTLLGPWVVSVLHQLVLKLSFNGFITLPSCRPRPVFVFLISLLPSHGSSWTLSPLNFAFSPGPPSFPRTTKVLTTVSSLLLFPGAAVCARL